MSVDPYTGKTDFTLEQRLVFRQFWSFLCLTSFMKKKNDYVVREVGGESIAVVFDGTTYRAFQNKCPHRQSPIYVREQGNGDLTCPFHGWSFKDDGSLRAIPFERQKYGFSDCERQGLKLHSYAIEQVGKFLFINLSESPAPLQSQIPPKLLRELEIISDHLDDEISLTRIPVEANWKLIPEITFDELHVPFVHSGTLFKDRRYDPQGASVLVGDQKVAREELRTKRVSASEMCIAVATENPGFKSEVWHQDVDRYKDADLYYDFFIFPNLHLVSADGGHSFSYEAFFPVSNTATMIDYAFMTAAQKVPSQVFSIVHLESMKAGLAVFNEDISMMELVQGNSVHTPLMSKHGAYEIGIERWRNFFRGLYHDE